MNELINILNSPQTKNGATTLMKLFEEITGDKIKVGCLCKQTNINKVYSIVNDWYNTTLN